MIGGIERERRVFRRLRSRHRNPLPSGFPNKVLADRHAGWQAGLPAHILQETDPWVPTIVAVGGGKGGVGKSLISANLAAKLGQVGLEVLLVDLDIGSSNLHTYFGLGLPSKTLTDFVLKRRFNFSEIIMPTPAEHVRLIAGGKDENWSDRQSYHHGIFSSFWHTLLASRKLLDCDIVILDLGAGSHRLSVDFFTAAHAGIVTVLPEPTSIENAYTFLKATFRCLIENAGAQINQTEQASALKSALFESSAGAAAQRGQSIVDRFKQQFHNYPSLCEHVVQALRGRQINFITNQVRSQKDTDIGTSMATISRNYFGYDAKYLGFLPDDDVAWKSLRNRRLLIKDFPHANLSKKLYDIAARLLSNLGY